MGGYFEDTLDSCCKRYFSWVSSSMFYIKICPFVNPYLTYELCLGQDYFTCIGASGILPSGYVSGICSGGYGTIPSGYYPNWGSSEIKCLESSTEMPGYVLDNPDQWLYDDIEACCKNYYNWEKDACIENSGGSVASLATLGWYVNHEYEVCVQDCSGDGPCGGLADSWDQLYSTVSDCCDSQLSWIAASVCEAKSTLAAAVGTSKWFVDWAQEKVRYLKFILCLFHCNMSLNQTKTVPVVCKGLRSKFIR